jgi:hypothetical protein
MAEEKINSPKHYGGADNIYEAIKIIEHFNLNFSLGSALKYIIRAGKKSSEPTVDDLKKAAWYCLREAKRIEALPTKDDQ